MADKTYRLTFGLSDGSEKAVAFTAPQGETGKTAYEYAVDGGYTGTEEEFAAKLAEEAPGIHIGPEAPENNAVLWVDTDEESEETGGGINVTAEVGQTILVKAVDESGKPTEWEAVEYQPRTHYSEFDEAVLFPEATVSWDETTDYVGIMELTAPLVVGNTYRVMFNGVEYFCDAFDSDGMVTIGNARYLSSDGQDTGEPFVAIYSDGLCMLLGYSIDEDATADSAIVSIVEIMETVHKIPDKYVDKDFRITVTINADMETHTVDKTFEEIAKAYKAGKNITLLYKGYQNTYVYHLSTPSDDSFVFTVITGSNTDPYIRIATITSDDSISISSKHVV